MTGQEVIKLITLIEDLEAPAADLVRSLVDKLKGATPEQIAEMAHALNATAIAEANAELGKLPQ